MLNCFGNPVTISYLYNGEARHGDKKDVFAVTLIMAKDNAGMIPEEVNAPPEYTDFENGILRIHGVNRNGNFGNQLNNMRFPKVPVSE